MRQGIQQHNRSSLGLVLNPQPPEAPFTRYGIHTFGSRGAGMVFVKLLALSVPMRFWVKGYCADTVGLDAEKIRACVKYQEKRERLAEQAKLKF